MEDIELARDIKDILELLGLSVFIAHQDIKPNQKWEEVIFERLKTCRIFVPLLTHAFRKSIWTDQETGIALTSESDVIPVMIDIEPYGFIKKYQGLRWDLKKSNSNMFYLATQIIDHLSINETAKVRRELIENLGKKEKCLNFDAAIIFAGIIANLPSLTKDELSIIADGVIANDQVHLAYYAEDNLRKIFNGNKEILDEKYLENKIIKKYLF